MPEVTKKPAAAGTASSKKKQDDALTELAKQIEKKETKAEKKRIAAAKAQADGAPCRRIALASAFSVRHALICPAAALTPDCVPPRRGTVRQVLQSMHRYLFSGRVCQHCDDLP